MSIIMYKQRFKEVQKKNTPIQNYEHIGYIATRPRAMKNEYGRHALFGRLGLIEHTKSCEQLSWQTTARYIKKLSYEHKNIYRSIISFNREDTKEIGLTNQKAWQQYAELHIRTLAEKNSIDIKNLGWCAAYHNEGDHPHLHFVFWDTSQKIIKNYVSPKIPNSIRVQLIKDTFSEKLERLYEEKQMAKDNINKAYSIDTNDFDEFIKTLDVKDFRKLKTNYNYFNSSDDYELPILFNSNEQLKKFTEQIFLLKDLIPKNGRLSYKLLPPNVKEEDDKITDMILNENSYLKVAVDSYIKSLVELKKIYSSLNDEKDYRDFINKSMADVKKDIGNKILKSLKTTLTRDKEIKKEFYKKAKQKQIASECMRSILSMFANATVENHSKLDEKNSYNEGDMSEREKIEWIIKNKDNGMEI